MLTIEDVPIDEIHPSPFNPEKRTRPGSDSLKVLKKSIEKNGILQPITITQDGQIADGHRRYACAKLLGMTHVPAIRRPDTAEKLFAELNAGNKPLNNSQWSDAAKKGFDESLIPNTDTRNKIANMKRIFGEDFNTMDCSSAIIGPAMAIARYIGDETDEYLKKIILWLAANKSMQVVVSNAMRNNVAPSVLVKAIENNKPIQLSYWA